MFLNWHLRSYRSTGISIPHILDLEKRFLFDQGPGYVGHEIMLPNVGDYYVPEWMNDAKMLVRNKQRHRAVIQRLPSSAISAAQRPRQCAEISFAPYIAGLTI